MDGDLISRSAFIKETCGACDGYCDNCGCDCLSCDSPSRCDFVRALSAAPSVDAVEVVHGRWVLQAHKERANYRWSVTAECSECCAEKKEIWAGFFPNIPDDVAQDVALISAEMVKLSNGTNEPKRGVDSIEAITKAMSPIGCRCRSRRRRKHDVYVERLGDADYRSCGCGHFGLGADMKIPTEDLIILACVLYIAGLVALVIMWKGV